MRVSDNIKLKGNQLFDHLCQYKSEIIELKKKEVIKSVPLIVDSKAEYFKKSTSYVKTKNTKGEENNDPNGLDVKVVANTTNWADSYLDVLVRGAYDETIQKDAARMVQLHDHIHKLTAKIGNVKDVKAEDVSLQELGLAMLGSTQALVFYNEIRREYNEQIFKMYEMNAVNQHSIGFRYQELLLAVNNPDYKDEYANWEMYYKDIINKSTVDERGYFWAVPKVKIYENSAVLFGANELTPTLSISNLKGIDLEELKDEEQKNQQEQEQEDKKQNSKLYYL